MIYTRSILGRTVCEAEVITDRQYAGTMPAAKK
jgi:hypothetical protein